MGKDELRAGRIYLNVCFLLFEFWDFENTPLKLIRAMQLFTDPATRLL